MKELRPDVAVVGASLAGLRAAWAAARGNADVLLLESRAELGVPEPLAVVAFDHLMDWQGQVPAAAVRQRVGQTRITSPGGHTVSFEAPATILDRAHFDRHLARAAQAAGAEVRLGVGPLRALDDRTLEADGLRVRAGVTIFADGAATQATRYLRPTRDPQRVTWGVAHALDADGWTPRLDIGLGSHVAGGRTQWSPRGPGSWSHWTFMPGTRQDAVANAQAIFARDVAARGADPASARLLGVAPDPVYTLPKELATDGVLVCGGAAGQGGVEVGLASGELAGAAAARALARGRTDRAALLPYQAEWRHRYAAGYRRLRRLTDRLATLDDAGIDRLLRPFDGEHLPLTRLQGLSGPPARRLAAAAWFLRKYPSAAASAVSAWMRPAAPALPLRGQG